MKLTVFRPAKLINVEARPAKKEGHSTPKEGSAVVNHTSVLGPFVPSVSGLGDGPSCRVSSEILVPTVLMFVLNNTGPVSSFSNTF